MTKRCAFMIALCFASLIAYSFGAFNGPILEVSQWRPMATLELNEGNGVAYQLSKLEDKTTIQYQAKETVHQNQRGLIKYKWKHPYGRVQNFGVTDVHYLISNPVTETCAYGSVRPGGTQRVLFPEGRPSTNYELRMLFLTERTNFQDTHPIKLEQD
ncbi:hypothetical protein PGT21_010398 [Puccinia graminis f. sp. tritici]|nr:hypothetical protein PGT21_010398 [Puccinia graminis f. sp. tritici]KAA1123637.1 hypothetical protein PGTUg99_023374 [Puccinia graminis f. sp. tritici]